MSGGVLARMRSDLGIGAAFAPPPGGDVRVAAARELGTYARRVGDKCRDGS